MTKSPAQLQAHNQQQIDYFDPDIKHTMVPEATPYVARQVDELLRCAGIKPGDRVIEIGCGMGRYSLPLLARGVAVEGLDISARLLERLRAHAPAEVLPLHCRDVLDCAEDMAAQYDAVIGFFTLHHLHDLRLSFGAMTRLLRPGGTLAFLEPNAYNPLYYVQMLLTPGMTWQGDGGLVRMRSGAVFAAMQDAGLVHATVTRFGFFPPFLTNRPAGARAERILEAVPIWRALLPFQLFRAERAAESSG
jgi:SAM-dependent methyltransferase